MIINGIEYKVQIIRKNNKNTYIRIKDKVIIVTTNYFTTNSQINKLIYDNQVALIRMANKVKKKEDRAKDDGFYLFGKAYKVIYDSNINNIVIDNDIIKIKDDKKLCKFLDNYLKTAFENHLYYWYNMFEEEIPRPSMKIRTMRSRWGVCNTKTYNITLNKELSKYEIECLDYVCIHELAHLIHPNHSKNFWNVVLKYCPDYKKIRKILRD